jgi:acyl-CoA thioesterase-1
MIFNTHSRENAEILTFCPAFSQQSQASKAKVLLLGMQLPPNYGVAYTRGFMGIYPKLAKKYAVVLIPYMLAGIQGEEFQADNLHPVAEAQHKILNTVMKQLKSMPYIYNLLFIFNI